jgi:hypothetical protein
MESHMWKLFLFIFVLAVVAVTIEELISAKPRKRRRARLQARAALSMDSWCQTHMAAFKTPPWIAWEVARCFAWTWKCDPGQILPSDKICLPPEEVYGFIAFDRFDDDLETINHLLQLFLGKNVFDRVCSENLKTIGDVIASLEPYSHEIENHREAWNNELRKLKPPGLRLVDNR